MTAVVYKACHCSFGSAAERSAVASVLQTVFGNEGSAENLGAMRLSRPVSERKRGSVEDLLRAERRMDVHVQLDSVQDLRVCVFWSVSKKVNSVEDLLRAGRRTDMRLQLD
jgi:hypothetical protein